MGDMDIMDTGTDMVTTMERDLLMLSPLPMLLPTLRLRLILGTDTTDMDTDHMDMATIVERGLLMLSPLPKPLPTLRLRLILGTDTTDMDTAHTDMVTGVKLKPTTTCCFSLPTLL